MTQIELKSFHVISGGCEASVALGFSAGALVDFEMKRALDRLISVWVSYLEGRENTGHRPAIGVNLFVEFD